MAAACSPTTRSKKLWITFSNALPTRRLAMQDRLAEMFKKFRVEDFEAVDHSAHWCVGVD
jgi:hypothetical protein